MYDQITDFIEEQGIRKSAVAERLGLSLQGLRNKLIGKSDFKASEIRTLSEWWGVPSDKLLGIDPDEE